jgi:hypothetical protein
VLRPTSLPHALAVVTAAATTALLVVLVGPLLPSAAARSGTAATVPFTSPVTSAAASRAPRDPEQPLVPRIRSITPDYVPDHGPIVIRGTVTNASDQRWTAINVHGFMGSTPITTATVLAQAARVPLDADVGHRIAVPGTFASIHSLAPGQSAHFKVRLPHATLTTTAPGVYWFGVHVLGDNGQGGVRVAVGRDRTFLAYVPKSAVADGAQEDTALVVPIRSGVVRGPEGTVIDPAEWARSLRSGALHHTLALGRAARGRPLTWVVDPAVRDVVRRLARGNPARTLTAPTTRPTQGGESPSSSAGASASDSAAASATGPAGTVPTPATKRVSQRWLREVHGLLAADTDEVLGLPYGDLAVESAARYDPPLLRHAVGRSARALRGWGLVSSPVFVPPDGRTSADTIAALPRDVDTLLDDTGVADDATTVNGVAGHRVLLASTGAAQGGPGPVDPRSSLALRQRILAEAALRLIDDQRPLVVELPTGTHRIRPSFFSGLEVPWLRLTTLDGATAVTPTPLDTDHLREPPTDVPQLGPRLYRTAEELLENGQTLQSVLTDNHVLSRGLFEEVVGNASYAASREPFLALERTRIIATWVRDNLAGIDLAAPESVTLASASGRFSAIVSNALDVPVTVKVQAVSDPQLRITGGETVRLPPHGRTSVLLNASTDQRGVHTVTLELTNRAGQPLGPQAQDSFPMRAEQVSRLIWVIIGAGVVLLFAAIFVRLTRRILRARARRRTGSITT